MDVLLELARLRHSLLHQKYRNRNHQSRARQPTSIWVPSLKPQNTPTISSFSKLYSPSVIISSRTSRFHLLHTTQPAPPQATPMDHYAAIRNARPRLLTEGNYIITSHVHPNLAEMDLNWVIEPENVRLILANPYLMSIPNISTGDQVSTARPCS